MKVMMTENQNNRWAAFLEEMDVLAETLENNDWKTITMVAGDAAPVTPESNRTDHHGYAYVVPGNAASEFEEVFNPDSFNQTEVYHATTETHLYLLTVVKDPPTATAVLIAGALERTKLGACKQLAQKTGTLYTDLFRVDGSHLGAFKHEDPEPFFPTMIEPEEC